MLQSPPTPARTSDARQLWWHDRTLPAIYTAVALLLVFVLLWQNALDVRLGWVRLFYGAIACWLISLFWIRSFRIWIIQKSLRDRADRARTARRIHRALEICLFGILWLLVFEAAARALPPLSNSSVNYPGHRFVWPERYAPRNSFGLNDEEPDLKGKGTRILVLGDSYVEGAGVRRQERFCSRLRTLLKQADLQAQVFAAGIGGWNTANEADFLERHGRKLAPDVVVVGYVLNDAEGADQLFERPAAWELWLQTRLRSYLCYRLFRWRRTGFAQYWQQVRRQHQPDSESWRTVENALRRIVAWCRRESIPCHLAVLPIFTNDAAVVRDVMDQVVTKSTGLGFTSYSLLDGFDGQWLDYAVSPHDAHPNSAGHDRIAERIFRELQSNSLSKPKD